MVEVLIDFWDLKEQCQRRVGDKFKCSNERKASLLETGKVKSVRVEKKESKPPRTKKIK